MNADSVRGYFLKGRRGKLFLLVRKAGLPGPCLMIVPPFAEEMNQCRRQIALLSNRLVAAGYTVALPDLYGTGDSEGEFGDATWDLWLDDLARVGRWLSGQGTPVETLLAIRLGCSLAGDLLQKGMSSAKSLLLWQPILNGRQFLDQFLRLRVVAGMANGRSESIDTLRSRISSGETVESGGYEIRRELADAIDSIGIKNLELEKPNRVGIFEITRRPESTGNLPGAKIAEALPDTKIAVDRVVLSGSPYWATAEAAANASLNDRTVEWLQQS